ncbi:MAG: dethiobiotin synthase [Azonexus sp.]|nr:dethiobiotin synthase [Burkholderiaceae bacterium]MDP3439687.1 dethiobiotin synthase [Azonexus sp.]MDP3637569.1 dethiobiotin synthase [Azonexus sp.]MDZ4314924.1 dethiobiotin synthase [Azonexus sp.]
MNQAYFLTGTDTEIGKTFITCALLHRATQLGLKAAGVKPIAAGTDALGDNEDVENILAASNVTLAREITNSYCFKAAVAPHIAAAEEGISIDFATIRAACNSAIEQADLVIIEGVGGFCVPLGVDRNSADLAVALGLPVILVIGLRLGCINHALLTAEAIKARGLPIAGWVANQIDPVMPRFEENLATLKALLPAPLLGVVPYNAAGGSAAAASLLQLPGTPHLTT